MSARREESEVNLNVAIAKEKAKRFPLEETKSRPNNNIIKRVK